MLRLAPLLRKPHVLVSCCRLRARGPVMLATGGDAAASSQPRRSVQLLPGNEFRFETDDGAGVTITLLSGAAEIFGAEMVVQRAYSFTDAQQVGCHPPQPLSLHASPSTSSARPSPAGRLLVAWLHARRRRVVRALLRCHRDAHGELPAAACRTGGAASDRDGAWHRGSTRAGDRPQGDRQVVAVPLAGQLPSQAWPQRDARGPRCRPGRADAAGLPGGRPA